MPFMILPPKSKLDLITWLKEEDPKKLKTLWQLADQIRKANVGDAVHLRGLLEISNYCLRKCGYCGINLGNRKLKRYRMDASEIINAAKKAAEFGYGTIVMQAGEDYGIKANWLAKIIRSIKKDTNLAITLSLGERDDDEFKLWKKAGADRYLLRFETSNLKLFKKIHPALSSAPTKISPKEHPRILILKKLRKLGYEIGSGVMLGVPGQTYETLANDILTFAKLNLDMIGVGPYLPHPETVLAKANGRFKTSKTLLQVPNSELMTYKLIALTRIFCPEANIPATTALATLNKAFGRESGLLRGANVVMPNITPPKYRQLYEIYPGKACINETAEQCQSCLKNRIAMIGRAIDQGAGSRISLRFPI